MLNKNEETKQRKRKIIWFNPPYSKNVLTKVRNQFLKPINKHFPRHYKFYKLFNKSSVKGNAQFIFLCNPQKSSVNVCLMNLIKKHCHKKSNCVF